MKNAIILHGGPDKQEYYDPETPSQSNMHWLPWLDPFAKHTKDFFDDFEINPGLAARTAGTIIFQSDNDMDDVQETVKQLRRKVKNIQYREFHNYGHFCYGDMKTAQFPELLEETLR
jgi:hypothetical protein